MFTTLSAVLFFGFVILGVLMFGLLSCYSAYGPAWGYSYPRVPNIWSVVTFVTAVLLVPVLIVAGEGSAWQFTGFLCPAAIAFVALTPDYGTNKLAGKVHTFAAALGAMWSVVFIICVTPALWWLLVLYIGLAGLATVISGIYYWCFWFEMAAYLAIFTAMFVMLL